MAGLLRSIESNNPKSDDWSTYKCRLEFYFQVNKITDAAMKRAALLTLIGITGSWIGFALCLIYKDLIKIASSSLTATTPKLTPSSLEMPRPQPISETHLFLKYTSLVSLTLQNAGVALATRYARSRPGPLFLSSTAVVLAEMIKAIVALGLLWSQQHFRVRAFCRLLVQQLIFDPVDNLKILVPALVYVLQNNLVYFSVSHLNAATFQVSYQLKILTTAMLSVLLLPNRRYSRVQWFALLLLFVGIALVQWEAQVAHVATHKAENHSHFHLPRPLQFKADPDYFEGDARSGGRAADADAAAGAEARGPALAPRRLQALQANPEPEPKRPEDRRGAPGSAFAAHIQEQHVQDPLLGFGAVILACIFSGLAGVYFEKVLKSTDKSVWLRNVQLGGYGTVIGLLAMYMNDGAAVEERGFLFGYDWAVWTCVSLQSVGGLLVAVVVRYADNVLKGFATSIAILLTSVFSVLFFGVHLGALFALGALLVAVSSFLFSEVVPGLPACARRSLCDTAADLPTKK